MTLLYDDLLFTFCFADDQIIPRSRFEDIEAGRCVTVIKIDRVTGEKFGLLVMAIVCTDWKRVLFARQQRDSKRLRDLRRVSPLSI